MSYDKEQCTVNDLKIILDDLSNAGYSDMPIFLGNTTPLLKEAIGINFSFNKGVYFKNTYYDKDLTDCANRLKSTIDVAIKTYLSDCYHSGMNIRKENKND